ncbi:MAG: ABC transporter substrate-binding protein [Bacteroidales bacterium]|nr:ABC transporter substrate-binding protein [Bacteroidales bacterium]
MMINNRIELSTFTTLFSLRRNCLRASVIAVLLLLAGGAAAQKPTLTFVPQWLPQAQFAGYYVALDKGFYQEAGLSLQLRHPRADVSAMELLKKGEADVISSFLLDGIKERVFGEPLVNIGQLTQHSSLMIVTKKKRGITKLEDLNGKKLAIWSSGFDMLPKALFREKGIDVEFVPILNTINLFLVDGVDAMTVMYYNEYDQIINSGINKEELNTFFFNDYKGFDIPEDGLYCLKETYQNRKEDLQKFVEATLRGWEYAREHKDYTIDLVVAEMNKAHLPNNEVHQRWMLDKMLEQIKSGDKEVKKGRLLEEDYYRALNIIKRETEDARQMEFPSLNEFYKPLAK